MQFYAAFLAKLVRYFLIQRLAEARAHVDENKRWELPLTVASSDSAVFCTLERRSCRLASRSKFFL